MCNPNHYPSEKVVDHHLKWAYGTMLMDFRKTKEEKKRKMKGKGNEEVSSS